MSPRSRSSRASKNGTRQRRSTPKRKARVQKSLESRAARRNRGRLRGWPARGKVLATRISRAQRSSTACPRIGIEQSTRTTRVEENGEGIISLGVGELCCATSGPCGENRALGARPRCSRRCADFRAWQKALEARRGAYQSVPFAFIYPARSVERRLQYMQVHASVRVCEQSAPRVDEDGLVESGGGQLFHFLSRTE